MKDSEHALPKHCQSTQGAPLGAVAVAPVIQILAALSISVVILVLVFARALLAITIPVTITITMTFLTLALFFCAKSLRIFFENLLTLFCCQLMPPRHAFVTARSLRGHSLHVDAKHAGEFATKHWCCIQVCMEHTALYSGILSSSGCASSQVVPALTPRVSSRRAMKSSRARLRRFSSLAARSLACPTSSSHTSRLRVSTPIGNLQLVIASSTDWRCHQ